MSAAIPKLVKANMSSRSPIIMTGAALLGFGYLMDHSSPKAHVLSLESQFGTSDGYFPTATKGALLSKPPGNKDHMVGERYVALCHRKSSDRRDMDQKYRH